MGAVRIGVSRGPRYAALNPPLAIHSTPPCAQAPPIEAFPVFLRQNAAPHRRCYGQDRRSVNRRARRQLAAPGRGVVRGPQAGANYIGRTTGRDEAPTRRLAKFAKFAKEKKPCPRT
ncbi:MAG TPA: hypothetical protein PKW87_08860 [Bacillota bacterium]|nr:hypothetical protein [Bacillota bacterium]